MQLEYLRYEKRDRIADVTLNRPEVLKQCAEGTMTCEP